MSRVALGLLLLAISFEIVFSKNRKPGPPGRVDAINKYSDFKSFGSVVLRCPIENVWPTIGNVATMFPAVIGDALINITIASGNGRQLQSQFNYFVDSPTPGFPIGRTQQRVIKLSDFDFEIITTFDSSTLPLGPWTTRFTLDRVTYLNRVVDYTLLSFAQSGVVNVPPEMQHAVLARIRSFFPTVFAPSLKSKFDRCK